MANNPLDLKEFKHYLNFLSDDTGMLQISEPVKFDASEFVIEQDNKGYARDISYMAEEFSLEFYKGFFEQADETYQLPDGVVVDKLGHAIEYLFRYNKEYGFQSQIEYILERNGTQFILGELNFEGAETDELTYFNCKVIQATKRALAKRREDTKIDVFSDTDLDSNEIEPLQTENILLQAKPVVQVSNWISFDDTLSFEIQGIRTYYYPFFNQLESFGIEDSLVSFNRFYSTAFSGEPDAIEGCVKVKAKTDLSDVNIKISNVSLEVRSDIVTVAGESVSIHVDYGFGYDSGEYTRLIPYTSGTIPSYPYLIEDVNLDLTIGGVPNDGFISVYIAFDMGEAGNRDVSLKQISGDLEITATSTAIDTVVKGVRYIDLAKQALKSSNGMNMSAPEFNVGEKYHNLFAFSGNLIRQRDDVPFYTDLKDRRENLVVMNSDIQINDDDAFALPYSTFYDNVDNGGFVMPSSDKFKMSYNPRYAINVLEWNFKDYEKDRDESNTLDAVHTKAQFSINNTRVKATKKIDVSDIYDPFKIESQRRQAFKETTALDGDDKVHVLDVVNLAPGTRSGFGASLTHNSENGQIKLLKPSNLPSWSLLGFVVDSDFNITFGANIGSYTVFEIEDNIITLTPVSPATQSDSGEFYTQVDYPLENVAYTNRTNEGFETIENLLNPYNFSNLNYTIRRNLINWESYINTCASYITDDVSNTLFKNNGNLVTQLEGGDTYTENGDIVLDTIADKILSPKMYDVDVIAEFDDVLALLQKYQEITTVGGFVRVQDTNNAIKKLYPQKLGYNWSTKVLNIVGEERREVDVITITESNGVIYIDEVAYDQDVLDEVFYEINGDLLALYDLNKIKLINFTRYDNFVVSGNTFENITDLTQAIIDLLTSSITFDNTSVTFDSNIITFDNG
tara:strand:+ start:13405 stop:16128 length:2724 start_codon:yes stop_codon:yes gene_type:complete